MRLALPGIVVMSLLAVIWLLLAAGEQSPPPPVADVATTSQSASSAVLQQSSTTAIVATSTNSKTTTPAATTTPKKPVNKPRNTPQAKDLPPPPATTQPVEAPYTTPPETLEAIAPLVRGALINILCMPQGGTLRPISGSGVIIDPRGVILTNAHVAQYVLLSQSPLINLDCTIRVGSPAKPQWKAVVLYIPPVWVEEHYRNINADQTSGTGEHDYALLLVKSDTQGNPVATPLPYLPIETRQNLASQGDNVLVAGYPAEFVGGIVAQQGLYASLSPSTIKQLLTFNAATIDVYSVGGVIQAQGGSSGGPVVNAWRHVIAIISTTSEGSTTATRDLHTLSLEYIERDLLAQTSKDFEAILSADVSRLAEEFSRETASLLIQKYIDFLSQ